MKNIGLDKKHDLEDQTGCAMQVLGDCSGPFMTGPAELL